MPSPLHICTTSPPPQREKKSPQLLLNLSRYKPDIITGCLLCIMAMFSEYENELQKVSHPLISPSPFDQRLTMMPEATTQSSQRARDIRQRQRPCPSSSINNRRLQEETCARHYCRCRTTPKFQGPSYPNKR